MKASEGHGLGLLAGGVLIMALQDHFRPPLSVRRHWHALQQADTLVTPLSERPLWCVAAGLLAGSLLGTAIDLPLLPLSGTLLIAGLFLLLPWPVPQVRRCCRLGLVGLALTSLQLAWQPYALPAH